MIILNAGVPRSGTVLVNSIVRGLLAGVADEVTQTNPHGIELVQLVRRLQDTGGDRYRTTLVHTHSWGPEVARRLAGSAYLCALVNYRDPRDICVSMMRLHEHDLETTVKIVLQSWELMEDCLRDVDAMVIPYELLVAHRPAFVFQIARRLGYTPGMAEVDRIVEATDISRHRAVMERVQAGQIEGLQRRQNRNRTLAEDPETLINDRHIQSGATGRWREELTSDQQGVVCERFASILSRYGYAGE